MILGIGTDLLDIRRLEKTLGRYGDRFCARVFTPAELARCRGRLRATEALAQRFAAKEACAKALGTGFRRGVAWRDIEVRNLPSGQPVIGLANGAARRLAELTPAGMTAVVHVTMSDEYPYAQAMVIISAVSAAPPGRGLP